MSVSDSGLPCRVVTCRPAQADQTFGFADGLVTLAEGVHTYISMQLLGMPAILQGCTDAVYDIKVCCPTHITDWPCLPQLYFKESAACRSRHQDMGKSPDQAEI